MWITKNLSVYDAYSQFQTILYRWLRFFGLFLGQDIFREDFKIHTQTVIVLMVNLSVPLLFYLTSYRFDDELGMAAGTFVANGLKVELLLNEPNQRLKLTDYFVSQKS